MARSAKHEDKSSYFVFKFILLSIFYSLSLYHSTNVIMLLDSFSHVEMLKLTDVIRLELQSLKVAEMLSSLMLRLELQNMKISHHILSSKLYYQVYFIHCHYIARLMLLCCWTPFLMLMKC